MGGNVKWDGEVEGFSDEEKSIKRKEEKYDVATVDGERKLSDHLDSFP